MSKRRITPGNLTIALTTLLICLGIVFFTACTPSAGADPLEDEPGFSCTHHGNKVCGDPTGERATQAWDAWDRSEGWTKLKVNPAKGFRVDYVGHAVSSPRLADNEAAMPAKDGYWYVFRAVELD